MSPMSGAAGRAGAWENRPGVRGAGREGGFTIPGSPRTRRGECGPPSAPRSHPPRPAGRRGDLTVPAPVLPGKAEGGEPGGHRIPVSPISLRDHSAGPLPRSTPDGEGGSRGALGVTALAAPARLKIVQVRVRSGCALCHLLSLGTQWPGREVTREWDRACSQRWRVRRGGCSGDQGGSQAELATPAPSFDVLIR